MPNDLPVLPPPPPACSKAVWAYQKLLDIGHPAAFKCPVCCHLKHSQLCATLDGILLSHLKALGGHVEQPHRELHARQM